jgi:ferrous iron transport protein A
MSAAETCVALDTLAIGAQATVQCVDVGSPIRSRLATLGFTPGTRLTVLQNFGHGPLIVGIRDTRIALGRQEAGKVSVLPL